MGEVPFQIASARVWVRPEDVSRACTVIAEFQSRLADRTMKQGGETTGADANSERISNGVYCYHCGASVDRGTKRCPACGEPLSWDD
jgi:hypothetical protein